MSSLAADLKTAVGLLKKDKTEDVINLLEPLIERGEQDYKLFCYVALADSKHGNFIRAKELFKQAIQLDGSPSDAWKGIFKVYEKEGTRISDEFGVQVCDKLLTFSDFSGKHEDVRKLRRRLLISAQKWTEFSKDIGDDQQLFCTAMESVADKASWDENEVKLLDSLVPRIENDQELLKSRPVAFLCYCKYKFLKREKDMLVQILSLCSSSPHMSENAWVHETLLLNFCETYFCTKTVVDDVFQILCKSSLTMPEDLALIRSLTMDLTAALEVADRMKSETTKYPSCLILIVLQAEAEDWESCLKLLKTASSKTASTDVRLNCEGWKLRAQLASFNDDQRAQLCSNRPNNALDLPQFHREKVQLALLSGNSTTVAELVASVPVSSQEYVQLRLLRALHENKFSHDEVELAGQLAAHQDADWQDLLLAAEVQCATGTDATALLVKAAKLNPRSSRVFFVLGRSLIKKNPTKARSCLERAVRIRPSNEEYVRLLDHFLENNAASPEARLALLKRFMSLSPRHKPNWLCERLAMLYTQTNNVESAIEELQQIIRFNSGDKGAWACLASAYQRKGHLRTALNSYELLCGMDDGIDFALPVIRILIQLQELDAALQKVEAYREAKQQSNNGLDTKIVTDILEVQIRLNLMEVTIGEERREHLQKALILLASCVDVQSQLSLVYKFSGDALLKLAEYGDESISQFKICEKWSLSNRESCVKQACTFFGVVLKMRQTSSQAWHDLAVALLERHKAAPDLDIVAKAKECLRQALRLTKDQPLLSAYWTLLADVLRLTGEPPENQQHCLVRALQLCRTNDVAWMELGVLYFRQGLKNQSSSAFEQAIKHNPHNGVAWCGWAMHAEDGEDFEEARGMFRQALTIFPTICSVVGYARQMAKHLKGCRERFDPAFEALDFERILNVREVAQCGSDVKYHLGVLCELFGYYPEAAHCYEASSTHTECIERIKKLSLIGKDIGELPRPHPENAQLRALLAYDSQQLYQMVKERSNIYAGLFESVETNECKKFGELYAEAYKKISVPLIVSAIITRGMDLRRESVSTLHETLPRHELIDVFPTALPMEIDNGLRHLEQDGEAPFRYRNHISKQLFDALKRRRDEYDEQNNRESS